jgi:nucleoside-diphosphate-sugar epimerase
MAQAAEKPSVLIIGGLGYIGRFLALHIHKNDLASEVRLVDKVLPQLAWLAPEFAEACSQDKFVQADASRERKSMASWWTPWVGLEGARRLT